MITLITGGPGLGKTALAIDILLKEYGNRPIFQAGIKNLTLNHTVLPAVGEWVRKDITEQGNTEYRFNFPVGSIVVIDECQTFFRPRANGSKVPPEVQAFETHRHEGIDFILITQAPTLLDSNVRKLVKGGRHIHLRKTYFGRYRYESAEVIDVENKAALKLVTKTKYKLPTHVYPLYKSAELHTKIKVKMPYQFFIFPILIIAAVYLFYSVYTSLSSKTQPLANPSAGIRPEIPVGSPPKLQKREIISYKNILEALTPTDSNNPLSAPIYATVQPAVVAPEILGCIDGEKSCSCYTQQYTPVFIPEQQCRERAAGKYYDPYMPESRTKIRHAKYRKNETENDGYEDATFRAPRSSTFAKGYSQKTDYTGQSSVKKK